MPSNAKRSPSSAGGKGDVLKATEEQRSWVRANRPDDETVGERRPTPSEFTPQVDPDAPEWVSLGVFAENTGREGKR